MQTFKSKLLIIIIDEEEIATISILQCSALEHFFTTLAKIIQLWIKCIVQTSQLDVQENGQNC